MKMNETISGARFNTSVGWTNFLLFVLLALWALTAQAVPPPTGLAPVLSPPGGFAIDGNLLANTPDAAAGDWLSGPGGTGGAVLGANGTPLNPAMTFHFVDPYNTTDDETFGGGLKWTDNPNTWDWTTGKPSGKTDINNVLFHVTTDADGHTWIIVAADRLSTSGDSYIDFEFLQSPLTRNSNGTFSSAGLNGGRTTNDLLLCLAFTDGGSVADFFAFRWARSGSGFAYLDATAALPAGRVFVSANPTNVAVPFGAFGQTTYAPNAYAEAAIDLTAMLGGFDPCLSIGIKTIMVKTKTSTSSSASIVDFIEPIQYTMKLGPSADAGPDQTQCTEGDSTTFALQGQATAGLYPLVSTNWSVVAGTATIDSTNTLATTAHVFSPTATLRLTVVQDKGCTETDEVVLTVNPLPACSITGPVLVCPQSLAQFQGPAGMAAYSWSITGNGSISGPANARTVTVSAGTGCGTNFTLSLVVTSNNCPGTGTTEVTVNDTTAPTLTLPADKVLECPGDLRTNVTGVATALDDCGKVTVSFSDSITNGCGGTKVIARTWIATDQCGNTISAVQTISVRDTTPPALNVPASVVLECPGDISTTRNGMATGLDACGSVTVTYSDSISNGCGGTKVVSRLWTATDECGNTTNALQTITVRDMTAPALTVPANAVLECPGDISTTKNGTATGLDACGSVTITYSDSISNGCGGTKVVSRLWTATDECGNTTNRLQTITVRDTTPPALNVPDSVVLECPGDISTTKNGMATGLDACGSVTITYSDSTSNGCGGTKVVSRLWTATDQCGNSTNALQTITVRDTTPPALTVPANAVLECPGDTSTSKNGTATGLEACGSVTITYNDSISSGCGGTKVVSRLWTATDQCGNATNKVQTITVRDTTPPALTVPASVVLECPGDTSTNRNGTATGFDTCGSVTITYHDSISNSCGGARVVSRLWTATDACGNATNGLQTLTVRDTTPPTLTVPASVTLECPGNINTNNTGVAMAQDLCGSVGLSYSDVVSNGCGGTKVVSRLWTATDQCGNATDGLQTITVRDTTPPALKLPANRVLDCPGDTRTNVTGVAIAPDACGSVAIIYSDIVSNSCGGTKTVWRTWTATDQCGNSTNGLQTIVVQDTTKPTINCRAINVQCTGDVPAAYTNLAAFLAAGNTATDSCDAALTFAFISESGLTGSCPARMTRVYRVTDDCGNFAEGTQTITVDDTIAPVLTCPTNRTVECGLALEPVNTGQATATDNCSTNVIPTYSDAMVPSTYSVNFYAADSDIGTGPYAPTYLKLGPASLPCPAEARLTGRAVDPLRNAVAYGPTAGQLDALTSLGGEPMRFGQVVPFEAVIEAGGGLGPERGTVEFTADWSTHTTSNDEFGFDKNYMVYCAFVDPADQGTVDPHYNARVESVSSRVVNAGTINEQIEGTFRISGLDSGDRVVVEIWLVLDATVQGHASGTIAAQLMSAAKATVPPEPISVGSKTISIGNLSKIEPLPAPQQQPPPPPLPPQPPVPPGYTVSVIDRTWAATDDCGNRGTCVQRITVRDTSPPMLSAPADVTLECPAEVTTNNTGTATALDACGEVAVNVSYSDVVSNSCGGTKTVWRTWTTTDGYNTTNRVQTITVRDNTPPAISAPENVVLEFTGDTSTDATGVVEAADACGTVAVQYNDAVSYGAAGAKVILRTWTATDACGNSTNYVQTITVGAAVPPTIGTNPPCRIVGCGNNTILSVSATGSGLLTYQWQLNGINIPGATGSALALTGLELTNAGLYTVVVSNSAGAITSQAAVVDVLPKLVAQSSGSVLKLTWPDGFHLESATSPAGPYTDVAGATSPYLYNMATEPLRFFRLSSEPFRLTMQPLPNGQMSISGPGVPGCNFIIQVSTNLINWANLATNPSPFVVVDADAGQYPARFYRAIPALANLAIIPATPPVITAQPAGQTASSGTSATLTVTATGSGPFTYQWRLNGSDIAGATGSSLTLNSLQLADAGLYSVVVRNASGTATSLAAVINVAPQLVMQATSQGLTLTWPEPFILQAASNAAGPYADVEGATSPYVYDTLTNPRRFFQLRSPSFSLTMARLLGGQVSVTGPGVPGCNFILQASTDLVNWVELQASPSPCTFLDAEAGQYPHRFYRAVLAH
jgi:hypothetical protein